MEKPSTHPATGAGNPRQLPAAKPLNLLNKVKLSGVNFVSK